MFTRRRGTVIIYTDCKGYSVGKHVRADNQLEDSIVWRCQEGLTFNVGVEWLQDELPYLRNTYGRTLHVYFWLGTCNLTTKSGRYIHLKSTYVADSRRLITRLHLLSNFAYREGLSLTLLEIPVFSLEKFNEYAGHNFSYHFRDQDRHLCEQINIIKEEIRELNSISYKVSPQFSLDLHLIQRWDPPKVTSRSLMVREAITIGEKRSFLNFWSI